MVKVCISILTAVTTVIFVFVQKCSSKREVKDFFKGNGTKGKIQVSLLKGLNLD